MTTGPTTFTGLTAAEVADRMSDGRANVVEITTSRGVWDILRGNLFTLFNAILGSALVVVLVVGEWRDALFGMVILVNTLVGTVAEFRAKRVLDRLSILHQADIAVVRDGVQGRVPVSQVVADDVVVLAVGDQVPADGEVLHCVGLEVDESMLTGESEPVDKAVGDAVLSGAAVVAGSAAFRTTRVGSQAYAQRLTEQARRFSLVGSELRAGINKVLLVISWVIVPIAALLFWSQVRDAGGWSFAFGTGAWRGAAVQAVAGIVGMVPDGLVLLTSINFALAAIVLARRQVLVQELPAVEVLARVDVLCLDKTGTLTDGTVVLEDVVDLAEPGEQTDEPADVPDAARAALAAVARDEGGSATSEAIAAALAEVDAAPAELLVPFSSARKWSAHRVDGRVWLLGAPEVLLAQRGEDDDVARRVRSFAESGARVLLLARGPQDLADDTLPDDVEPVLLAVLRERVRPDAAQTLAYFAEQGVEVKVVSGDNPATVAAIAGTVGLGEGAQVLAVDARSLPAEGAELDGPAMQGRVFGRVTPEQKRSLVHALQRQGRTVAMTGDGVNDALALKDADLGIAMGNAAPATTSVARLVLLDGRFATLPGVVAEGRRVIANMERVASLFLAKTTYAVVLAVVVAIVGWQYPFLPRHLTLVGALTIGVPAFLLALAPNDARYRRGFLERVLQLAVPAGLVMASGVLVVYGTLHVRGLELQATTGATLTLLVMALWLLAVLARPWLWWRLGIVLAMALGALLAVTVEPVRTFFALQWPVAETWTLVAVVGLVGAALVEVVHRLRERVHRAQAAAVAGSGVDPLPTVAHELVRTPDDDVAEIAGQAGGQADTDPDVGSEAETDTGTDVGTDDDVDVDVAREANVVGDTGADAVADSDSDGDADTDADPDGDRDLDTDSDADTQTHSDGETENEVDADTAVEAAVDAGADPVETPDDLDRQPAAVEDDDLEPETEPPSQDPPDATTADATRDRRPDSVGEDAPAR